MLRLCTVVIKNYQRFSRTRIVIRSVGFYKDNHRKLRRSQPTEFRGQDTSLGVYWVSKGMFISKRKTQERQPGKNTDNDWSFKNTKENLEEEKVIKEKILPRNESFQAGNSQEEAAGFSNKASPAECSESNFRPVISARAWLTWLKSEQEHFCFQHYNW